VDAISERSAVVARFADRTPFETIESALEYVALLGEVVEASRHEVCQAVAEAVTEGATRRVQALRIVDYKLTQLGQHLSAGRRVLIDLRKLRRVLLGEERSETESREDGATQDRQRTEDERRVGENHAHLSAT
jgi:hypothetical protein